MSNGKETRNLQKQQHQEVVLSGQVFQGPLPHPDILVKYNDAQPKAADRIIKMAEKEQGHRHFLEKAGLLGNIFSENLGLLLAAALFAFIAWGGLQLIREGYEGAGISTVIGAVLGPLVTYLIGRKKQGQP